MSEVRLEAPNPAEQSWVDQHVALAGRLSADRETAPSIAELDALWASWLDEGDPAEANDMINVVGLAFGQRLVDDLGMTWVVATDDDGTEIAVHHPAADTLVMPPNLVAKRWQTGERGFLGAVFDGIAEHLARHGT